MESMKDFAIEVGIKSQNFLCKTRELKSLIETDAEIPLQEKLRIKSQYFLLHSEILALHEQLIIKSRENLQPYRVLVTIIGFI
jgi:hypothetical protein